jgi:hypothetical protein
MNAFFWAVYILGAVIWYMRKALWSAPFWPLFVSLSIMGRVMRFLIKAGADR